MAESPSDRETAQGVLDFVSDAGYELSRGQLVLLHRRGLIGPVETRYPGGRRGAETVYPGGTAERVLRIAQMKTRTKNLDEIAWRLWWEGRNVDAKLVKTYLYKIASRWDKRRSELRVAAAVYLGEVEADRDLLDETFHKKRIHPPLGTIRRRLKNGDAYVEFLNLLVNLMLGRAESDRQQIEIFEKATGYRFASSESDEFSSGEEAITLMNEFAKLKWADYAKSLGDEDLRLSRDFVRLITTSLQNLGEIMHDLYGGTGQGYVLAAKTLEGAIDDPDQQIACLLLYSVLLRDPNIRDKLPTIEAQLGHINTVTYADHLRLRYLRDAVPALRKLLTPSNLQSAYSTVEGALSLKAKLAAFQEKYRIEFEAAIANRPDLFY